MNARRRSVDPGGQGIGVADQPPLLTDMATYQEALSWLERLRALLEGAGVWTVEFQSAFGQLGGTLLLSAAGRQPSRAAHHTGGDAPLKVRRNGQQPEGLSPNIGQVSLNDRLQALGYASDLSRSTRIQLGHRVVQAYRAQHGGQGPQMGTQVQGARGRRVALYEPIDLPLVDHVLQEVLGPPALGSQGGTR
jgi:hypothetical protein